ncbi:MAG: stalk domain-containing protein [Bacillota bacterium]|jgi:hypothetical protein
MMKKIFLIVSLSMILILGTFSVGAFASINQASFDNEALDLNKNQKPYTINNKKYFPLRKVIESCGYQVKWEKEKHMITIPALSITINLNPTYYIDKDFNSFEINNGITFLSTDNLKELPNYQII